MSHIFVSHATADDGIVSKLHDELEAATGLNMWVDHKDLKPPEDNFRETLHEALKACDAGLLVLSKNTIKRDEIVAEWNYVLTTERPLYVAKVDDIAIRDINPRLLIVQWVDLNANWEAGVRTLAAYMRGENAPADAPLVQPRKVSGIEDRKLLNIPMSGRDAELKETLDKLKREPVMIVGVGGRGKSRLAAEAALRSTDSKGAVWHKVSDISSAEDVINRLREHFEMANDALRKDVLGKLKQEKTLVVIDNAESAEGDGRRADYCKLVETLLSAGAQVLLTGRAEWNEIDPLGVVRPEPITEIETAIQILLDMGKVFESPYDLQSEAEGLAKAALMHPRLMEWAVKQTKREAPKDVLKQLKGLKSKDVQKALDEMIHKTLRQMTAVTGDDQAEKLLQQLVVFRGSFTMEAAEVVTNPQPPPLSSPIATGEERTLDDLRTLRNHLQEWQFVTMQTDGNDARYRVDGLVLEVLTPDEATRSAHFAYYYGLHGDHNANNDETRHPLIERDWENVRAALAWGFEHEVEAACDLATALDYYMYLRVSYEIWRETLIKAQQAAVKTGYTSGEANTLKALGGLDLMEDHYADARTNYALALAAFRQIPSRLGEAQALQGLGDLDRMEDHYDDARTNYTQALNAFRQIPARIGEANTLKALGDLDLREAYYDDARANYAAAFQAFSLIPSRRGEAQTLQALGDLDFRENHYADARANYTAAFQAYRQIPDRLGEAQTLQALGDLNFRENHYADARTNYALALAAFRQIPSRIGEANILQALGDLDRMEDQYADARTNYALALAAFRQIPSRIGEANTLKALGSLDHIENNFGAARANYKSALEIYSQISDRVNEANTLAALGLLDQTEGQNSKAYGRYKAALKVFREISDRVNEANTLAALGLLNQTEGQNSKAYGRYKAALKVFREIPNRIGEANTLLALGRLDYMEERNSKARKYYIAALKVFREISYRIGEAITLQALGDIDQSEEQWDSAYDFYIQSVKMMQSLSNVYLEALVRTSMWPTLAALERYDEAIKANLFAYDVFTQIGLPHLRPEVQDGMIDLQKQMGKRAFKKAWKRVMGDAPLPEWLE